MGYGSVDIRGDLSCSERHVYTAGRRTSSKLLDMVIDVKGNKGVHGLDEHMLK